MTDHPLKAWRLRCNYTHRELARIIGTSYASIARIEQGYQMASPELARKIERLSSGAVRVDDVRKRGHEPRVYFVQCVPDGPIKVGVVFSSMRQRMNQIQLNCPYIIKPLGTVAGAYDLETQIKHDLADWSIHGEWFRPVPEVKSYIRKILGKPITRPATAIWPGKQAA
jgi:DNA-binding XRE family transcriptional regulator